ncbi:MAG: DUF5672 family protein [Candidatus Paceibacterota bacterium]
MAKRKLETVTLLGIDCVNIERLILAASICQKDFEFAQVKLLTSLESNDSRIVKIEPIRSIEAYSEFMITKLNEYVETPHVLIIQHDGFILNPEAWTDDFLKYDYIGAPWLVSEWSSKQFGVPRDFIGKHLVGNGGFSLRSKKLTSLCAKLASSNAFKVYHPEDVALGVHYQKLLEDNGIEFAPLSVAKQFSFESDDTNNVKWDGQFGFHGLFWTDISKWLEAHPEYNGKIVNNLDRVLTNSN